MSSQIEAPIPTVPAPAAPALEIPHSFPDVGIDPRFRLPFTPEHAAAAEKIKEERERTGEFNLPAPASSMQPSIIPPQPVPCIGIRHSANIPYTEEHAKEAQKIGAERAAADRAVEAAQELTLGDLVVLWVLA
ncbi:hypothetical protein DFH09DRAFT_1081590 [Mycena vulgaris]|nr:hypothetical protein DFH09DRAFT_1081590 [Mycena vulgaris]